MAIVNVVAPARRSSPSREVLDVKENWKSLSLVKDDAEEGVGVKRCFLDLQKSYGAMRCKVPGIVSGAIGLDVKLIDDTVLISSPGANKVADLLSTSCKGSWRVPE